MLGKLALQRTNVRFTHLTALAVMAALVVGLFGALAQIGAQEDTVVKVTKVVTTSAPNADPVTSETVTIEASDKDGVIGDGDDVTFTATVKRTVGGSENVNATTSVAIAPFPGSQGDDMAQVTATDIHGVPVGKVYFPAGTADGEYTVTVAVDPGGSTDGTAAAVNFVFKLRNADPGTALASASIGFGKYTAGSLGDDEGVGGTGDDMDTLASCEAPGATEAPNGASAKYGTPICLMVSARNSLGNPAQDEDIKEIIVSAPTANVYSPMALEATPLTPDGVEENSKTFEDDSATAGTDESPGSTQYFLISRPESPGTVEVTVLVIGEGTAGFADAGSVTLTFTGDPETISLDEPSSPLAKDGRQSAPAEPVNDNGTPDDATDDTPAKAAVTLVGATIKVSAEDAAGSNAVLAPEDISVTAADANGKPTDKVKGMPKELGTPPTTTIEVWSEGADAGVYTLTVKLGTKDSAMVDVVVSGGAASVSLATEWDDEQTTLTATATVMDKDGNLVPNTTSVQFDAIGSLDLRARSGVGVVKDNDGKGAKVNTMNGVATLRFSPISESGTARIFASVVDAAADDVDTVSIEAEPAEAMPAEEASLSCLSETNSFSTWTCEVDSSASEVFGWVNSRGASAIHLWNGSAWVRFSVVEGQTVPGSSDFQITQYNQLYISN